MQIFNEKMTYQPSMRRLIFWSVFFFCFFLDCRSTKLLRLFSGNLLAMFCETTDKTAHSQRRSIDTTKQEIEISKKILSRFPHIFLLSVIFFNFFLINLSFDYLVVVSSNQSRYSLRRTYKRRKSY